MYLVYPHGNPTRVYRSPSIGLIGNLLPNVARACFVLRLKMSTGRLRSDLLETQILPGTDRAARYPRLPVAFDRTYWKLDNN
jgi:hypothetical protein